MAQQLRKAHIYGRMQLKVLQFLQDGDKSYFQVQKHIRRSRCLVSRILSVLLLRGDISYSDNYALDPKYRLSDKYKEHNFPA